MEELKENQSQPQADTTKREEIPKPPAERREFLLQFFESKHLPPEIALVARQFAQLALFLVQVAPANPERTTALRKLLEAKDCAVRAKIAK
jgi:hypothetical protein